MAGVNANHLPLRPLSAARAALNFAVDIEDDFSEHDESNAKH